jgi:hypothetical protein
LGHFGREVAAVPVNQADGAAVHGNRASPLRPPRLCRGGSRLNAGSTLGKHSIRDACTSFDAANKMIFDTFVCGNKRNECRVPKSLLVFGHDFRTFRARRFTSLAIGSIPICNASRSTSARLRPVASQTCSTSSRVSWSGTTRHRSSLLTRSVLDQIGPKNKS